MNFSSKERKITILIFIASLILFLYYLFLNYQVNYYDETGYINISKMILTQGIFSINEALRTYFYSLLIACISIFTNGDIFLIKIGMSVFQYLFYIYTIYLLSKKMFEFTNQKSVGLGILFFGLLNPYLIQSTTLFLTDILATCCVILALTYLIFGDYENNKTYLLIFLYGYIATMIRPSSLVFIPIIIFLLVVRKIMIHDVKFSKCIIFGAFMLIVFFPQLYNNVNQFNHWTPLIHADLYEFQSNLAASNLKYGTVVIPNENAQLFFLSPYETDSLKNGIFELIYTNFPAFLTVYFAHLFGVLDWGYIETYITDFYPISRIIGSLFLYSFWIFGFYGLYLFAKKNKNTQGKFITISFTCSFILYWGFIGTTIIESRFGYPLYLLTLPFIGMSIQCCLDYLKNREIQKSRKRIKIFKFLIIYVILLILIFYLSFLIDFQTGRINWLAF